MACVPVGVAHRQGSHHDRDGQEGQADLQCVVAQNPAQVELAGFPGGQETLMLDAFMAAVQAVSSWGVVP